MRKTTKEIVKSFDNTEKHKQKLNMEEKYGDKITDNYGT